MKTKQIQICRWQSGEYSTTLETVTIESPLDIRINSASNNLEQRLAVTLRTPDDDIALVYGYLFSEGIISKAKDCTVEQESTDIVRVHLGAHINYSQRQIARGSFIHSGCGLCGKTFIEAIHTLRKSHRAIEPIAFESHWLDKINTAIQQQNVFEQTGGSHAAALFDSTGNLLHLHEDIGRHNAVDKVIGSALINKQITNKSVLWISGRAGFELVQKAIMAGVGMLLAVGAPSSLSVEIAQEFNMTLVAFARNGKANIYHSEQ